MNIKILALQYNEVDNRYQQLYRTLSKMVESQIGRRESKVDEAANKARFQFENSLAEVAVAEAVDYLRDKLGQVRDLRIQAKKELDESLSEDLNISIRTL